MSDKQSPINVGVIGLGRSGWGIHLDVISTMPEMYRLVAVADQLALRAHESAATLQVRKHQTYEQLLADREVELVVVATYNTFHARQAAAALRAGKHVLCEKPFGLISADVDMMIAASRTSGKVLQPFQQRRFEPDFQTIREVVHSGILGQIQFVRICWHAFKRRWDWQTDKSMGGGTMNNNGPHLIDHAMELYGEGDPNVWCEMRRCLCAGDAEDHLKIILTGQNRPTIDIELSDTFAYGQDRWLVCGNSGGLRGTADELEWKWVDWSKMPPRPVELSSTPDRSYNSEKLEWKTASWRAQGKADAGGGAAPARQPTVDMYTSLYKTIRQGAPQLITPQEVRRRVVVMEKARQSGGMY